MKYWSLSLNYQTQLETECKYIIFYDDKFFDFSLFSVNVRAKNKY